MPLAEIHSPDSFCVFGQIGHLRSIAAPRSLPTTKRPSVTMAEVATGGKRRSEAQRRQLSRIIRGSDNCSGTAGWLATITSAGPMQAPATGAFLKAARR